MSENVIFAHYCGSAIAVAFTKMLLLLINLIPLYPVTLQKQPRRRSIENGALKNLEKFTGKYQRRTLFFNKVADLRPPFLSKKLQCRCFLRKLFLTELLRATASDTKKKRLRAKNIHASSQEFYGRFLKVFEAFLNHGKLFGKI